MPYAGRPSNSENVGATLTLNPDDDIFLACVTGVETTSANATVAISTVEDPVAIFRPATALLTPREASSDLFSYVVKTSYTRFGKWVTQVYPGTAATPPPTLSPDWTVDGRGGKPKQDGYVIPSALGPRDDGGDAGADISEGPAINPPDGPAWSPASFPSSGNGPSDNGPADGDGSDPAAGSPASGRPGNASDPGPTSAQNPGADAGPGSEPGDDSPIAGLPRPIFIGIMVVVAIIVLAVIIGVCVKYAPRNSTVLHEAVDAMLRAI
jgi:hypothetical protein